MLTAFRSIMWPNVQYNTPFNGLSTESQNHVLGLHPFGEVLKQIIPCIDVACRGYVAQIHCDLFMDGLMKLWASAHSMPSWLVVACQTYIDIWDVIGRDSSLGRRELNKRVTQGPRDGQAYKAMPGLDRFEKCYPLVPKCFAYCQTILTYCMQDPINKAFEQKRREETASNQVPTPPRHQLLEAFPLYAGSLVWAALQTTYRNGVLLCNGGGVVLALAYLYKTCSRAGLLNSCWTDMDFVIDTHSKKRPLLLEPQNGVQGMAKNFAVALGVSPVVFSGSKRPVLPDKVRRNKKLEITFPLLRVSEEGNHIERPHMENVAAALRCVALVEKEAFEEQRNILLNLPDKASPATSSRFTPTQLLSAFKDALVEHETDLNFNYTGFYMRCWELLHETLLACENYFILRPPKGAPHWNLNYVEMVGHSKAKFEDSSGSDGRLMLTFLLNV